jgi:purine-nucleoside phosphorylase
MVEGKTVNVSDADVQFERADRAAQFVLAHTALRPLIAVVLGSGLGGFADELAEAVILPYADIPHYPLPSAEGHAGKLVIGRIGKVPVIAMQGRVHLYEGLAPAEITFPMRVFGRMGIQAVILTNAAGGVSSKLKPGCLAVIEDHINLQGANPLVGPNEERFGTRFVDMTSTYCKKYRELALRAGRKLHADIVSGVYAALTGPSYETPAEIRFLRKIGADLVGMSTVAEAIVARHMGIRVLAISCVTNMAAGITGDAITHQEVLVTGERVGAKFLALLRAVIPQISDDLAQTKEESSAG